MGEDLWCPRCRERLRPAESYGQRLARCPSCEGLFLGAKPTAHLLGRLADLEPLGPAVSRLPCPRCARPMRVLRPGGSALEIDRCSEHGLWFDRRELELVAAHRRRELPLENPRGHVELEAATDAPIEELDAAAATLPAAVPPNGSAFGHGALLGGILEIIADVLAEGIR